MKNNCELILYSIYCNSAKILDKNRIFLNEQEFLDNRNSCLAEDFAPFCKYFCLHAFIFTFLTKIVIFNA